MLVEGAGSAGPIAFAGYLAPKLKQVLLGTDFLSEVFPASNSSNVLVVDDDADICSLVCKLLERAGFETAGASSGEEGLKKLFSLKPSVVVLDVGMPGMDGIQILEPIRDVSDVPVLMLTAKDGELEKVRGLRAGADDYVTKPFGINELLARLRAALRRHQPAPDVAVVRTADFTVDPANWSGEQPGWVSSESVNDAGNTF